ncbi:MAG: BrnT family toxin [Acidobacteriota bacterium]
MELIFEWDAEKAESNVKRHKVSFHEAKTIFDDPFLMTFPDPEHSNGERRYVNVGRSTKGRVMVVVHTQRGESTRIISCRKATASERRFYEEGEN